MNANFIVVMDGLPWISRAVTDVGTVQVRSCEISVILREQMFHDMNVHFIVVMNDLPWISRAVTHLGTIIVRSCINFGYLTRTYVST